jgi:hypothetical protein
MFKAVVYMSKTPVIFTDVAWGEAKNPKVTCFAIG